MLLRVAEELDRALGRLEVLAVAERAQELEPAAGQVFGRGIEQGAVIGERDVVEVETIVVGVERGPTAVLSLHAEEPAEPTLLGRLRRAVVEPAHFVERHHHHRGVVEVRVEVVAVLERPAARLHVRPLHLPVARHQHLAIDHPVTGALQLSMVGRQPALDQRVDREGGVPDRRRAGLIVELVAVLDHERLDLLELSHHERMIVRIAEQPQREDRVGHRRVDPAQTARDREPLLEPHARRVDRALAQRARREALPDLEAVVDRDEEALPEEAPPGEGLGHARKAEARSLPRLRPQLVEGQVRWQPLHRLAVHQDEQRDHDRARPVGNFEKNGAGSSMISAGMLGTPFQSYSPNSASWILVKTSAFAGPPISRICSRAAAIAGSLSGTPASFMAK